MLAPQTEKPNFAYVYLHLWGMLISLLLPVPERLSFHISGVLYCIPVSTAAQTICAWEKISLAHRPISIGSLHDTILQTSTLLLAFRYTTHTTCKNI